MYCNADHAAEKHGFVKNKKASKLCFPLPLRYVLLTMDQRAMDLASVLLINFEQLQIKLANANVYSIWSSAT